MNLKQFLEGGTQKVVPTRYDPDKEAMTDPELEAIKKKVAKAKTFDEIKAILTKAQPKGTAS